MVARAVRGQRSLLVLLFIYFFVSHVSVCKSEHFTCRYLLAFSRLSLTRDERKKRRARQKTGKDCIFFNLPVIVINRIV